jgi:hypothetical protein
LEVVASEHEAALGLTAHGAEESKGLGAAFQLALVHHCRRAARQGEGNIVVGGGALLQPCFGALKKTDAPVEGELGLLVLGLFSREFQEDGGSAAVGVEDAHAHGP